jgi:hypothetical protein
MRWKRSSAAALLLNFPPPKWLLDEMNCTREGSIFSEDRKHVECTHLLEQCIVEAVVVAEKRVACGMRAPISVYAGLGGLVSPRVMLASPANSEIYLS